MKLTDPCITYFVLNTTSWDMFHLSEATTDMMFVPAGMKREYGSNGELLGVRCFSAMRGQRKGI